MISAATPVMPGVLRELLWALLCAVLSLPLAYVVSILSLSLIHHGYALVDPVRLRRTTLALAVLVFVATFLAKRYS